MIKIGKRIISQDSKPLVVAEIGINHYGSLKIAKKIVDCASNSGAEAVKVQIHIPDEEMSEEAKKIKPGNSNINIFKIIERNSLTLKEEKKLKNYIEKKKLIYIATPFSYKAAKWLNDNNVKIIKIGSGECNNIPFIKYVCSFKKPMIISTGMNNLTSVKKTVKIVKKHKIPHALLHCVNLYPVNYKYVRLHRLKKMIQMFKSSIIGYSDHSIGNTIPIAALALGAKIIEKHFVIKRNGKGPDIICSMDKTELKDLIVSSNNIHAAFSSKKEIINQEDLTRKFAFHSVVSKKDINKNEKLSWKNLTTKRPGTGDFPSYKIYDLFGKKAKKFIKENRLIKKKSIK
jgi:N-acetylneuraminate synthase